MANKNIQMKKRNGQAWDNMFPMTLDTNVFDENGKSVKSQLAEFPKKKYKYTKVKMIAHRGLSGVAPENSLPAFNMAGKCGFWGAECDIQLTNDGEWVVMHDTTLDRTTNGSGNVRDLTLSAIQNFKIDAGSNIELYPNLKVPTLIEYLDVCKKWDLTPVIELKDEHTITELNSFLQIINEYNLIEDCIVISFKINNLSNIRTISKKIWLQYLATITQENIDFIKVLGNADIDSNGNTITKEQVKLAHENNIAVNVYTINDYNLAKTLSKYQVDYITTNIIGGVI